MRRFAWVLSIETGFACVLGALAFVSLPIHLGTDFGVYYAVARELRLNPSADIYQWSTVPQSGACHPIGPYIYPPVLAISLIPATLVPCEVAIRLWILLNGMLVAGSLVLCQELWPLTRRGFAVLCVATFCSYPLWMGLWYGQVHIVLLFGLLLALWCLRRGHQFWAGVTIAASTSIMLIPGLFLVYFALRREWRALLGAAASGAAMLLVMLLMIGGRGMLAWTSNILLGAAANSDHPSNLSLAHQLPWLAPVIALVYVGVVVRMRDGEDAALWTISTLLLLSPLTWAFMLLWLLPVVRVQWDRGWVARTLCLAAYCAAYVSRAAPLVGMAIIVLFWLAQLYQDYVDQTLTYAPRKSLLHSP